MAQPSGIVTLLTDFGTEDVYVGVMKGVILQINPAIAIVDLTHRIPPQNIGLGAFQLQNAYRHFPPGTVHVGVVDPGVGSTRNAIALAALDCFFVGPDNGIFTWILANRLLADCAADHAVALDNPRYWYTSSPSRTFHGRDIFAAVAAHLASGIPLSEMGQSVAIEHLVTLDLPRSVRECSQQHFCRCCPTSSFLVCDCGWTSFSILFDLQRSSPWTATQPHRESRLGRTGGRRWECPASLRSSPGRSHRADMDLIYMDLIYMDLI
jgi:S-adenosyl-l-methionine hydroxide adenosyltransferase